MNKMPCQQRNKFMILNSLFRLSATVQPCIPFKQGCINHIRVINPIQTLQVIFLGPLNLLPEITLLPVHSLHDHVIPCHIFFLAGEGSLAKSHVV